MGRLHISGGCYHVLGRGLEYRTTFEGDADKLDFLRRFGGSLPRCEVQCLAGAIMSNHCHFLLRLGPHPLSKLMDLLLGDMPISTVDAMTVQGMYFKIVSDPYYIPLAYSDSAVRCSKIRSPRRILVMA